MAVHRTKQKTQKAKPLRYAERIRRLREHLALTPAAFATRLGAVGDAQWVKDLEAGKYRMGKRGATPDAFAKLWDESGLDAAGQMTAKKPTAPGSGIDLRDRVPRLCERLGITRAQLATRLHADPATIDAWAAGQPPGPGGGWFAAFVGLEVAHRLNVTPPPAAPAGAAPAAEPWPKKVAALRETVRAELRARGLGTIDDGPPPPKPKETQETKATAPHRTTQRQKDDGPPPPTGEQYRAYMDLFHYFNRVLFADGLPEVLLSFSRHAKKGGFYAPERWHKDETKTGELALNPKALSAMTPESLTAMLVSLMVSLWQYSHGTPGRRGYHNAEWADQMETLGLMPSATGHPGGKRTGSRMSYYIIPDGPFTRAFAALPPAYLLPWLSLDRFEKGPEKKDPSKTPYTCPACGVKVWGKPDLELRHIDCDERMKPDA
jgi:DNA-binding transcriptional regulator YiaG